MSKKVIEQEIEPDLNIELLPDGTIYVKPMFPYTDVYIEESVRTTVAKAICPEYQKAIDHNKFLEFENARLTKMYQKAVNKTHGLNATNAKLVEALGKIKEMLESPKLIDGRVLRYIVNEAIQNNKKIEGL